ncbi:MAG: hypothetical protein M1830_004986 [Pleopsidium flavum]|nr:MAG: hypothetical protein M1830_004986 [Pleopsidium flavum]
MSSYLSSILSTTSSRYNSLRRSLLSDEADGDTEDDTHICRVLRAYYTEKGRPFPPWLPPDPKAPQQYPSAGYGGKNSSLERGSGGGGLSDLWESPRQSPAEESMSLRRAGPGRGLGRSLPQRPGIVDSHNSRDGGLQPQTTGRPLPSQRVGSYQSQFPQQQGSRNESNPSPVPSSGSGISAQERLKAKLWGARSASPTPSGGLQSPPISQEPSNPYTTGGSYASYSSGARGGSANDGRASAYVDRRAVGGGGSGRGGRDQKPIVSATTPWISGDEGRGEVGASYDLPPTSGPGRWGAAGGGGRLGLSSGSRPR